jgi:hypothetical protein
MRRGAGGLATAPDESWAPAAGAPGAREAPLRTEFEFELPLGYVDRDGELHRRGVMRLATARDELIMLYDAKVRDRPEWLTVVLLAAVVTKLGTLARVDDDVIEHLFASDLAFLQDLYRRINQEGHTRAAVTCPSCDHEFTVDVAGGRQGGS